jgi:hypothetical protein
VNIVDDQANNFRKEKWISYISMNNGSHDMYHNWNQVPVAMLNPKKCRSMLHWETHPLSLRGGSLRALTNHTQGLLGRPE